MKRQEDGVREVIEFCHNNTECRRSYVLRYFGETFSPADCKRSCDTCVNAQQNQLTTTDATKQAKTIIQLVETLSDGLETNVSEKQAMNCYTGANLKELRDKGLDRHPLFGAGKGQPKELVSRLFADLIVGNALELVSKENSAGWHTTYVTVSDGSYVFEVLRLTFCFRLGRRCSRSGVRRRSWCLTGPVVWLLRLQGVRTAAANNRLMLLPHCSCFLYWFCLISVCLRLKPLRGSLFLSCFLVLLHRIHSRFVIPVALGSPTSEFPCQGNSGSPSHVHTSLPTCTFYAHVLIPPFRQLTI